MARKKKPRASSKKQEGVTPRSAPWNRPGWALTGALMASVALGGAATPVFAQQDSAGTPGPTRPSTRRFDIPAGPLSRAMAAWMNNTGINVFDPQGVVGDLRTPGVTGVLGDEEALHRLLAGTGLTYRFTSSRALRLERGELRPLGIAGRTTQLDSITAVGRQGLQSPKYAGPPRDVPQTVNVVPQAVIQQQGATSLREVLRNVSGLTVNAGEGGATPGDNFNVRGFSARSDVFVDGVRDVGGYSRQTFNIEQVEVAKGPGSTYTGRGSTGGSINLVTKTPHIQQSLLATGSAGTEDYGRVAVDLNQPLDDAGVRGAAVRLNAEWQDGGVAGLDVVKKRSWGVAPSLAFGLGTRTELALTGFHNEQNNIPTYGITSQDSIPHVDTHNFFGLTDIDHERVNASQAGARLTHQLGAGLSLRNQLSWSLADADRLVTFASPNKTRASRSHITHDANLTNLTSLQAGFRTGAVRHDVALGVELTREHSTFAGYTLSATPPSVGDLNDPNPDDAYTGTISERRPTRDASARSAAVYAFETMKLGERLELNGGLRWDYFRAEYQDSLGAPLDPAGTTTKALTGRAGIVYKPAHNGSVYAAYGTSFNPSGELLALDSRGNAGLDPERSRTYEVGTKWDVAGERLSLTAAAFRTEKTNARMANPDDPSGPQILAGDQRVDGIETTATGHVTRAWSVFGGYTWMDSEIVRGAAADVGHEIPNTPRHTATLWTSYTFPWRLEVGAGARYVGRRYVRGTFWVPSYTTADAEAALPVGRQLSLRLNLYNLTDETYYDTGRFWVPAAGRSARLTAEVKL